MPLQPDNPDLQRRVAELESLLHDFEQVADPALQSKARQIVDILLEFHGAGLAQIMSHIAACGSSAVNLTDALARDQLVASLLVLHGLHPADLETRVRQALDKTRPYLHSHGGDVELLGIAGGAVRLRLQGSCHHCPSSSATLKDTIVQAIQSLAPDIADIQVEPAAETDDNRAPATVQLTARGVALSA